MDSIDANSLPIEVYCRICLQLEDLMVHIYDEVVEHITEDLSALLEKCGGIKVDKNDCFPKFLCRECTSELLVAARFREKCERSLLLLGQAFLQNDETKNVLRTQEEIPNLSSSYELPLNKEFGFLAVNKDLSPVAESDQMSYENSELQTNAVYEENIIEEDPDEANDTANITCNEEENADFSEVFNDDEKEVFNQGETLVGFNTRKEIKDIDLERNIMDCVPEGFEIESTDTEYNEEGVNDFAKKFFNQEEMLEGLNPINNIKEIKLGEKIIEVLPVEYENLKKKQSGCTTFSELINNFTKEIMSQEMLEGDLNTIREINQTELGEKFIEVMPDEFETLKEKDNTRTNYNEAERDLNPEEMLQGVKHLKNIREIKDGETVIEVVPEDFEILNEKERAGTVYDEEDVIFEFFDDDTNEVPNQGMLENMTTNGDKTTNVTQENMECLKDKKPDLDYVCDSCGALFKVAANLHRHMRRSHLIHEPHTCEKCDYAFSLAKNYNSHITKCTYKKDTVLSLHKTSQQDKLSSVLGKNECKYCGKQWPSTFSLNLHLRTHTGERPYTCKLCPKAFKSRSALLTHEKRHEGTPDHVCTVCDKTFYEASNLKVHMRTHTGEKNHECSVCKKRFSRVFMLELHMRTHTGEKPYQCRICNRAFTQLCDRNNHERTHTGERLYQCNICGKSFIKRYPLVLHMEKHVQKEVKEQTPTCFDANESDVSDILDRDAFFPQNINDVCDDLNYKDQTMDRLVSNQDLVLDDLLMEAEI